MASLEIEDLPDKVLVEIFSRLDQKTRVQMLSVNQRWQRLMPFDHLNVAKLFEWPSDVESVNVTSALREVLPQIGSKVKSVEFGNVHLAAVHTNLIVEFCAQLSSIDFQDTRLSEPNAFNFTAIRQMSNLKSLRVGGYFSGDWISDWSSADQARFLLNLSNLVSHLDLKEFRLVCLPFPPSFVAPNLTELTADCGKGLTDEKLADICTVSSNITTLSLDFCFSLKNFTPISRLSKLTKLKLKDSCVDEVQMEMIARNCPQLNSIDVHNRRYCCHECSQVTRINWLRHLPNLKCLAFDLTKREMSDIPYNWAIEDLEMCADLSEPILLELSDKSPRLKRLHLQHGNLSDDLVVKLSDRWELLEELRLSSVEISDESVAQLAQRKNLRLLDLRTRSFIVDSIRLLLAKREQLQISTSLNVRLQCFTDDDYPSSRPIKRLSEEELMTARVRLLPVFYKPK